METIPEKIALFRTDNDWWCSDVKNSKGMKRGRELIKDKATGRVDEVKNDEFNTMKLLSVHGDDRYTDGVAEFLVELSDGFRVALGSSPMTDILLNSKVDNGVITCPMIWATGSTYAYIVRVGSGRYQGAINDTIKSKVKGLSKYDIKVGYVYQTEFGNNFLYLGYGSWVQKKEPRGYYSQYSLNKPATEFITHEGHFWRSIHSLSYSRDDIIAGITDYNVGYTDVIKSTKKVIKEVGYNGFTLQDLLDAGQKNCPHCHYIKTLKVGK